MKNSITFRQSIALLAVSAFCYVLLHVIFNLGDFPLFTGNIGPKNFLPLAMGLLLGPFGAVGVCAGAVAAGLLAGIGWMALLSEALSVLVVAGAGWLLWYAGKGARIAALKTGRDIGRFLLLSFALSGVCALAAIPAGANPLLTFGSYMAWNMLLGIPVIMLMTSIFCINIVYPPWHPIRLDINEKLPLEEGSIALISDEIDALCFAKKLDRKRGFQLQSCIEECMLLIMSEPGSRTMWLTVRVSDSISINLYYDGLRYNPLRTRAEADQIGLTLIKNRALRAYHRYSGGLNKLHIVQ